ncbi:hypothetical protein ElyMa_003089600 [Elysia marginata]|uniref:Uncharacterized protein n=1 Tax=Elysia marginata TaxID=1093978 RepID=A0AAV4ILT0_9GAST|nr:hypothetical protein ElyMa_003089600 [Elysia marginata]
MALDAEKIKRPAQCLTVCGSVAERCYYKVIYVVTSVVIVVVVLVVVVIVAVVVVVVVVVETAVVIAVLLLFLSLLLLPCSPGTQCILKFCVFQLCCVAFEFRCSLLCSTVMYCLFRTFCFSISTTSILIPLE